MSLFSYFFLVCFLKMQGDIWCKYLTSGFRHVWFVHASTTFSHSDSLMLLNCRLGLKKDRGSWGLTQSPVPLWNNWDQIVSHLCPVCRSAPSTQEWKGKDDEASNTLLHTLSLWMEKGLDPLWGLQHADVRSDWLWKGFVCFWCLCEDGGVSAACFWSSGTFTDTVQQPPLQK